MHVVFGVYELDMDKRELRHAGEIAPLEPKAFNVLAHLIANRHRAVAKTELLETLWPDEYVTEAALTRSVRLIRQAVGDTGHQQHVIKTLRGYGYRFTPDVIERPTEAPRDTATDRSAATVEDDGEPETPPKHTEPAATPSAAERRQLTAPPLRLPAGCGSWRSLTPWW